MILWNQENCFEREFSVNVVKPKCVWEVVDFFKSTSDNFQPIRTPNTCITYERLKSHNLVTPMAIYDFTEFLVKNSETEIFLKVISTCPSFVTPKPKDD